MEHLRQESLKVELRRTESSAVKPSVAANTTSIITKKGPKILILSSSLLLHLSPARDQVRDQGLLPHLCCSKRRPGRRVQTELCGLLPSMQRFPFNQNNIWICAWETHHQLPSIMKKQTKKNCRSKEKCSNRTGQVVLSFTALVPVGMFSLPLQMCGDCTFWGNKVVHCATLPFPHWHDAIVWLASGDRTVTQHRSETPARWNEQCNKH